MNGLTGSDLFKAKEECTTNAVLPDSQRNTEEDPRYRTVRTESCTTVAIVVYLPRQLSISVSAHGGLSSFLLVTGGDASSRLLG